MSRPLHMLYVEGAGDVVGTYRQWRDGNDDATQTHVTHVRQVLDVCRDLGARVVVLSHHDRRDRAEEEMVRVVQRPRPGRSAGGMLFHLGMVLEGLRIIGIAIRIRADVVIVTSGVHWFMLSVLPWLGIRVVPNLNCVLWPQYRPLSVGQRLIRRINRGFFRRSCHAILCMSHDVARQIDELTGGRHAPVFTFVPTYRRELLGGIPAAKPSARPFRVLFAGRIERNKGVFDLLAIARDLAASGEEDVEFDLCGDGAALEALRDAAVRDGVDTRFRCHGHCGQADMRRLLGDAHVVVVPTRTTFIEGFNMVVVEGVLAGRPVITSRVCPAIEYVRDAVVEVEPDDVAGYRDAILALRDDPELYQSKVAACEGCREQFLDPRHGFGRAVREALDSLPGVRAAPEHARSALRRSETP